MGGLCQHHMHMAPQVSTQEYPLHVYVGCGDIHVHVHTYISEGALFFVMHQLSQSSGE